MSTLSVKNSKGKEVHTISLNDDIVKERVNKGLLYQVVTHFLASSHRGLHKTKTRAEVRGGGAKPWRQKGTGRARFGSIRNPLWKGGGTVFGPSLRSHAYPVPKTAKRKALKEALKSRVQSDACVVFDTITLESSKTKEMCGVIDKLGLRKKCLIVMESPDTHIVRACKNIKGITVTARRNVNALDVLRHDTLAIAEDSLKQLL